MEFSEAPINVLQRLGSMIFVATKQARSASTKTRQQKNETAKNLSVKNSSCRPSWFYRLDRQLAVPRIATFSAAGGAPAVVDAVLVAADVTTWGRIMVVQTFVGCGRLATYDQGVQKSATDPNPTASVDTSISISLGRKSK